MAVNGTVAERRRRRRKAFIALPFVPAETVGRVRWCSRIARLAADAAKGRGPTSPHGARATLRHLREGFLPQSQRVYRLHENDFRDYVSDRQREMTWKLNWPAAGLIDDKLAFYFMLEVLGAPTPRVHGVIIGGGSYELGGSGRGPDPSWLRGTLNTLGGLVVKPIRDGGGHGVLILEQGASGYRLNRQEVPWSEIEERLGGLDDCLVSDFVRQAAYAERIYPGSPNTIRILTMHDPGGGGPFLAAAAHRFGSDRSRPVDNWTQGGLSARIDLETGTLGSAAIRSAADGGAIEWVAAHPDTGARIEGSRIANWTPLREGVLTLARSTPFLPYVAWDVLATESGFEILEGNKFSALNVLQVHKPLLRDERVRAFYAAHGIV